MKILGAGDIHGDMSLSQYLAKKAVRENAEIVLLCGDISGPGGDLTNVIKPFKEENLKVFFVPGNHDDPATSEFLEEFYDLKSLEKRAIRYEDIGIFGHGATNIGLHYVPEEEVLSSLKANHDKISYTSKKIMVSHVHPEGSKMGELSKIVPGSRAVRKAISLFKPDLLLCSHVHEAHGLEETIENTRVINVGRTGKIIDL